MTSIELATELNNCLGTVAQERKEYRDGLNRLAKQVNAAKKDLLKMLKKEPSKSRRKLLKKDLLKLELACQRI